MSVINYTDIHCHIIPGVDDGAQSMEQAQEMIQIAYESGTRNIIATPHYGTHRAKASKGTIAVNFLELQMWMQVNYPDMKLYLGQELSYKHGTEDALKRGAAFTLAGSRYALVEFEPEEEYSRIRDGLQAIQMAGYWPILAHAERCNRLAANVDYIEELVHMGVYIQVNARSITGENGWQCKSCTKKLLKYEFKAILTVLIPVAGVLLLMALLLGINGGSDFYGWLDSTDQPISDSKTLFGALFVML